MQQTCLGIAAIHHHHPEDFDGVQAVGLGLKECATLFHSRTYQWAVILRMRDCWTIVLEENLIQPRLIIQCAERGFKPFDGIVPACMVETLVINAANL